MKLYTEEQIKGAMLDARISPSLKIDFLLGDYNPIELPSDEEIDKEAELVYIINKGGLMWMPNRADVNKANKQEGFSNGAKWVIEQIKKQDK